MRVGVDLDGVCFDFAASLREYLRTHVSASIPMPAPVRWEFYEDWGLSESAFKAHCYDGVEAGIVFCHGNPFPGTREALQRIQAAGHTIHIVTDRSFGKPGSSEAATLRWLNRHDLPFDSITFSPDKTVARVEMMVDDKAENYLALTAAGVDAYLLTRPWNQHVKGAQRVLDLLHFAERITNG